MADQNFLENMYFGNRVIDYIESIGWFVAGVFILVIVEKILIGRLKKWTESTEWDLDDHLFAIFEKAVVPILYLASFYFAVFKLEMDATVRTYVSSACVILLAVQITRLILGVVVLTLERTWRGKDVDGPKSGVSKSVLTILRIGVWSLSAIFILDNLGFNVSAVVAGLGISGIAVAFAAQAILGDLFSYFVIFFDKPFREGDFIIMGDYLGVVEHIGIKTTRLRSLGGEQIVCSNADLTSSRIRNYKRMEQRRVFFKFGVVYQTTSEQLKKIPGMVKSIIEGIEGTVFDRTHFHSYGDSSLDFEVVYYVIGNDYNVYMDIQERINLAIFEAFEKDGIDFAYPTRTLYVNNQ